MRGTPEMLKILAVTVFCLPLSASAKMMVTQLSSGADGLARFEVSSDQTGTAPVAGNGFVLVVRADATASASAQDFVPVDSVNFMSCGDEESGCQTFGLGFTDAEGDPLYFGAPMLAKQPVEIAIETDELCQVGMLQAGGKPTGCSVDPSTTGGYAQTGSVNLQFSIFNVAEALATPPSGKPVDQSGKVSLAPAKF
jgi:hypothetical protein